MRPMDTIQSNTPSWLTNDLNYCVNYCILSYTNTIIIIIIQFCLYILLKNTAKSFDCHIAALNLNIELFPCEWISF